MQTLMDPLPETTRSRMIRRFFTALAVAGIASYFIVLFALTANSTWANDNHIVRLARTMW